jgi:integrase
LWARGAVGRLTALKIKGLKPGRHGDGGGLWLQVRDAERRSWLFRYTLHGRAREMGLGPAGDVSLAEAREAARKCRAMLREGLDPLEQRRAARQAAHAVTFREVCDRYLAAHQAAWRNEKHKWQWRQTLDLACQRIGARSVRDVDTGDVMSVLEPLWRERTETASRLRGRIEAVLDYATARDWRAGPNPAAWRGHLAKLLPAPGKVARVAHFAALAWPEIAPFMGELRAQEGVAAAALEFTILTAARSGETRGATWAELDLASAVWTVPASRMKAGREHRVPLSDVALAVLRRMEPLRSGPDGYVFPGARAGRPLSDMAMIALLRRMGRGDLTAHGFRSSFRDWCAEATHYPRELAEAALAHTIEAKVEAAYRRGDLFAKRRALMADWAAHCAWPASAGEVTSGREEAPPRAA